MTQLQFVVSPERKCSKSTLCARSLEHGNISLERKLLQMTVTVIWMYIVRKESVNRERVEIVKPRSGVRRTDYFNVCLQLWLDCTQ